MNTGYFSCLNAMTDTTSESRLPFGLFGSEDHVYNFMAVTARFKMRLTEKNKVVIPSTDFDKQ